MDEGMIKAVIYDIDDTLYDLNSLFGGAEEALCREASSRFSVPPETFRTVFRDTMKEIRCNIPEEVRSLTGSGIQIATEHDRLVRVSLALNHFGFPLFPHSLELYEVYWNYVLDHMVNEPYILPTLQELRRRGYIIGIGSNMTSRIQYLKVQKTGAGPYVDFMVVSEETVVDKPDPRFFALAAAKADREYRRRHAGKCLPEECLFIGDNYRLDFQGARNAGLKAIWYNHIEKPWNHVSEEEKRRVQQEGLYMTDHRQVLEYLQKEITFPASPRT